MILYLVSGGPKAGKTTLARSLVGQANVWDLDAVRHWPMADYLYRLKSNLLALRQIAGPRIALDGIATVDELAAIRSFLPHDAILHFHVSRLNCTEKLTEEMFQLGLRADYAVNWGMPQ